MLYSNDENDFCRVCTCDQGYQTGYAYPSQPDRAGSDAELAPSTVIASSLTGSDRDLARLGSAYLVACDSDV